MGFDALVLVRIVDNSVGFGEPGGEWTSSQQSREGMNASV